MRDSDEVEKGVMIEDMLRGPVEVFSTCPPIRGEGGAYLQKVADAARWSEQAGCRGMLVYADNSQLDAWLVSQTIVENTQALSPLVAVQPAYMHPYTVAKMVTSIGCLYRRRVYLNMVAGGFKNDLAALNDTTPHDKRDRRHRHSLPEAGGGVPGCASRRGRRVRRPGGDHRARAGGGRLARGPRAVPGGPSRPAHPSARHEGVGFGLARAVVRARRGERTILARPLPELQDH